MRELKIEQRVVNRNIDSLQRYLNDLGSDKPLKPDEEVALAKRIHQGDEEALNRLVKANLKFVVSCAKKYAHVGIPLNDLVNEGNIGLIRAAKTYDETKGFKFISYAVWYIRAAIFTAFGDHLRTIRLPMNQVKAASDARVQEDLLFQKLEREPSLEELAEQLGIRTETLASSLQFDKPMSSMDVPSHYDNETSLWNLTIDQAALPPDQDLNQEMMRAQVRRLISKLPDREQELLKDVYGLDREYAVDFEQLGLKWGKTPTWARQLNRKAIATLKGMASAELMEFI